MKFVKLNNDVNMPQIGLGTFLIPNTELSSTIKQAYELGYRAFDTAWRYHNEHNIALALKENNIKREDVFITTKVNIDALYRFGYKRGKRSIFNVRNFRSIEDIVMESFDNLQTEYIDLFLVHWPWKNYLKMYKVLTKLYHQGRIRAIGVCSCLPPHLEALKEVSDVCPAINQFEISPLNSQKELIKYCQERGIMVEAMSTFSHFRSNVPRKEILEDSVILSIARKYGKSAVQIILKWLIQQEVVVIPKTWNVEHLKENISIDDFILTDEDMLIIDSLDKGKFLNYNPYPMLNVVPKKYRNWPGYERVIDTNL